VDEAANKAVHIHKKSTQAELNTISADPTHFPNNIRDWGIIDEKPSKFIHKKLHTERWKRWKQKPTQGLLPRLHEHSLYNSQIINNHSHQIFLSQSNHKGRMVY